MRLQWRAHNEGQGAIHNDAAAKCMVPNAGADRTKRQHMSGAKLTSTTEDLPLAKAVVEPTQHSLKQRYALVALAHRHPNKRAGPQYNETRADSNHAPASAHVCGALSLFRYLAVEPKSSNACLHQRCAACCNQWCASGGRNNVCACLVDRGMVDTTSWQRTSRRVASTSSMSWMGDTCNTEVSSGSV